MKIFIQLAIVFIVIGSLWFVLNKNEAPSFQDGKIQWMDQFQEGLALSKKSKKPVLVFFSATWCYWCRKLNQDVFMKDDVASLSERFINILIDVDKNPELASTFGVRGVPDIYFMDQNGKQVVQYNGNRTSTDIISQMRSVLVKFEQ